MLRLLSRGITTLALILVWLAIIWLVVDVIVADPAILVFEDLTILCAVLAPVLYLIGWGLGWCGWRFARSAAPRRA